MIVKRHKGFTLIEGLIAMVVLAIGLLGLAGMQLTSLKASDGAYFRSQATVLSNDILDCMRSNRNVALAGGYDIDLTEASTGSTVAAVDLQNWKAMLSGTLPAGDGSVNVSSGGIATVTIQWNDSRAKSGLEGGTNETFAADSQL